LATTADMDSEVKNIDENIVVEKPETAKMEETSFIAILDASLVHFRQDTPENPVFIREQSQQNLLNSIDKVQETDPARFSTVVFSNDLFDNLKPRLLDSPIPNEKDSVFVSANYDADPDPLELSVGMPITRSGSVESLKFDPDTIFFDAFDEHKEYPRTGTPTKDVEKKEKSKSKSQLSQTPVSASQEVLKETPPEPEVERIDRNAAIQEIVKNLEMRDKLSNKNTALQSKLAEYFKRKRVSFLNFNLILDG
jgi:hypothetical protein